MITSTSEFRVLIFGTSGTGKTSLCNALTGTKRPTGDGAKGVTFEHHVYPPYFLAQRPCTLIDTVGLNEADKGRVSSKNAVKKLIALLRDSKEGYNLLIHVFKKGRITKQEQDNYEFFCKIVCESKIPVLLVVTGCEELEDMSSWGRDNAEVLKEMGLDYLSIVGTSFAEGGRFAQQLVELRKESSKTLNEAIQQFAVAKAIPLYDLEEGVWATVKRSWNWFMRWIGLPDLTADLNIKLMDMLRKFGFSEEEATEYAENGLKE